MGIKQEIYNDFVFSPTTEAITTLKKTQSKFDWQTSLVDIRALQIEKGLSSVYEFGIVKHGISCECCDKIPKESVTCPTTQERQLRSHRPGRPRLRK